MARLDKIKDFMGRIDESYRSYRMLSEEIELNSPSRNWRAQNDEVMRHAIETLSDAVMHEYVCDDDLVNATDLDACTIGDIEDFYDITCAGGYPLHDTMTDELSSPFSVKAFNKKYRNRKKFPIFEDFVKDNWEDILDEETVDAIYDRRDVGSIVDKNAYGGGGFEVMRGLEIAVSKNVAQKILDKFRQTEI